MIHLYTGNGKGKTTAAVGLAVRAAGAGKRVVFLQFLKGSQTGEEASLKALPGVTVLRNGSGHGFYTSTTETHQSAMEQENNANLRAALDIPCDMLILDEAVMAYNVGAVDRALIDTVIEDYREGRRQGELVMTGGGATASMIDRADYVTEMRKVRHPYDKGIQARKGVEF
jgi:cob(I)alamin adenosyltransferase